MREGRGERTGRDDGESLEESKKGVREEEEEEEEGGSGVVMALWSLPLLVTR